MRQDSYSSSSIWNSLEPGDAVTLCVGDVPCHSGTVDDLTEDHQTIWVVDEIGHRRLFHISDDYDLKFFEEESSTLR